MDKPSVFIGSSTEGLKIAKTIQLLLDRVCEVTIWSQGVFGLSKGYLEELVSSLEKFDFAILVLTPDDMTISRETESDSPRDNVIFELGLFVGGIGRNRTYVVYDRTKKIKIPSDLAGISMATFELHSNGNLESSLGACCTRIENEIEKNGLRENKRFNQLADATKNVDKTNQKFQTLINLMARSRKVELDVIASQFGAFINTDRLKEIKKDLDDLSKAVNE
ncbi:TIR domain-containing protein [Dyadobacter sp. NIV53]|uniref:TIR domain-containing protein n=1 Tax=Dyadobacter sp. NIV53 TaxID=2861765 RepID=UPI001C88B3B0|nr:TIR domain-containing protein [Dyadobacter sp. NIV53]